MAQRPGLGVGSDRRKHTRENTRKTQGKTRKEKHKGKHTREERDTDRSPATRGIYRARNLETKIIDKIVY